MKTCAFRTLGCKVNQYETQAMRELFTSAGYREVSFRSPSEVYVINTCTVTAKTDREGRYLIRQANRTNPRGRVIVTGCYTELDEEKIRSIPGVSLIVKNRDKARIIQMLEPGAEGTKDPETGYTALSVSDFKGHTKAYLKVQDGCDNFCSYCKVPLARGRSRSRSPESAVEEMKRLVDKGFKEIILTGICLGAWGGDFKPGRRLIDLLRPLASVEGDFRIRLSSVEPKYVDEALTAFIRSSPKICRHLHVPLQSGDDDVLRMMNRPYTADGFRAMIASARKTLPEVSITTDALVGFPGESDSAFDNTCRLLEDILPSRIHVFPYSRREGTAASLYKDGPPFDAVRRRLEKIRSLASSSSFSYRKRFLNRATGVLIETERDRSTGLLKGYDDKYIKVVLSGPDSYMSSITPVRIERVEKDCTIGAAI